MISDNMVIQQQTEVRLWGWSEAGKKVNVSVSWNDESYSTKADSQGKWAVNVNTPKASYETQTISFNDGEETTINNVLIGEVWVAAGQSNMEMPVAGFD